MTAAELRLAARASGITGADLPTFEQVERRRSELWVLSGGLLLAMAGALSMLSLWSSEELGHLLQQPATRFGPVLLVAALGAYFVEKERHLRRLGRLLLAERLLTTGLTIRLQEISTLLDSGKAVNSSLELDRVLASILTGATELMPATRGSVMLLDGDELVVAAAVGASPPVGQTCRLGDGIAGHVAVTLQPILLNGRADAADFPGLQPRETDSRSSLCVPLVERGRTLGVLNLSSGEDGQFSEYDLRAVSLFAEQAAAAIGLARLYETSRLQSEQLAYAASHDALTGLANRAALTRRATDRGNETLLFLDLDGFKDVNDALGHQAGDELLSAVAQRLTRCVSSRDLVARFGGDEFAILLDGNVPKATATRIAARILDELRAPFTLHGTDVSVTASVGVAVPRLAGEQLEVLLRNADRALYRAKAQGKACWCVFDEDTDDPMVLPRPRSFSTGAPVRR